MSVSDLRQTPGEPLCAEGLRAQKRTLLRRQLSARAVELFVERGYEATTVDDIIAAEMVSRSTFFRYFRTKEDVVLYVLDEMGAEWLERYRELLADDPPWLALPRCTMTCVRSLARDPRLLPLMELTWETPRLRARRLERTFEWRTRLEALTAEYLGSGPTDLLPGLLTHAVIGAAEAAFGVWVGTHGERDILDLLDEALAFARCGYENLQPPPGAGLGRVADGGGPQAGDSR